MSHRTLVQEPGAYCRLGQKASETLFPAGMYLILAVYEHWRAATGFEKPETLWVHNYLRSQLVTGPVHGLPPALDFGVLQACCDSACDVHTNCCVQALKECPLSISRLSTGTAVRVACKAECSSAVDQSGLFKCSSLHYMAGAQCTPVYIRYHVSTMTPSSGLKPQS